MDFPFGLYEPTQRDLVTGVVVPYVYQFYFDGLVAGAGAAWEVSTALALQDNVNFCLALRGWVEIRPGAAEQITYSRIETRWTNGNTPVMWLTGGQPDATPGVGQYVWHDVPPFVLMPGQALWTSGVTTPGVNGARPYVSFWGYRIPLGNTQRGSSLI